MLSPAWGLILWLFAGSSFPLPDLPFTDRRLWWLRNEVSAGQDWRLFETRPVSGRAFPERLGELEPVNGRFLRGILTRHVFRLLLADIDGNGESELLAGVDRLVRGRSWRRLYIYRCRPSFLEPLWLGSKFSHRLLDFSVGLPGETSESVCRNLRELKTRERVGLKTIIGTYRWDQFGFGLVAKQEES